MTVVQEAGQILGGQLENSLAAITPAGGNTWSQYIGNPSDPATNLSFTNSNIPANTIVVYVGCDPGISLYQTFLPDNREWFVVVGRLDHLARPDRRTGRLGTDDRLDLV